MTSPDEALTYPTLSKNWNVLLETLDRLPEKTRDLIVVDVEAIERDAARASIAERERAHDIDNTGDCLPDCWCKGESSLVERLCVKDAADDADPDWCRTHSKPWHFCQHRPLVERLTEDRVSAGPTRVKPNTNELEAATALSERDTIIAGYNAMIDDAHKITGELHSRVAELEAGLNKIIFEGNHNSAGYTVQCQIARSLLSKEP